jgi:hypothetical protein
MVGYSRMRTPASSRVAWWNCCAPAHAQLFAFAGDIRNDTSDVSRKLETAFAGAPRRPRRPEPPRPLCSVLETMIVFQGPHVPRGAPTRVERE